MLSIKIACPKHPRFNPAIHGEGDIKGGCTNCYQLRHLKLSVDNGTFFNPIPPPLINAETK